MLVEGASIGGGEPSMPRARLGEGGMGEERRGLKKARRSVHAWGRGFRGRYGLG